MPAKLFLTLTMISFTVLLCGCTITENARPNIASEATWSAIGYYGPLRSRDPIIIGAYQSERACEDGLDQWLTTQVVGNEISGECLPIDRD